MDTTINDPTMKDALIDKRKTSYTIIDRIYIYLHIFNSIPQLISRHQRLLL